MNLPNKLTMLRICMIPLFVALLMQEPPLYSLLAAIVFGIASVTDLFDGWYARKHSLITDFGKLMDPMADKLLVMTALVGLLAQGRVHWLAVMVLLAREFLVSSIRLVAASKGLVIAAGKGGKLKTATQMVSLALITADSFFPWMALPGAILLWLSVALSLWSCVEYIAGNKGVFAS